jgi:hypothetical protein
MKFEIEFNEYSFSIEKIDNILFKRIQIESSHN